jgi:hypothetical protein
VLSKTATLAFAVLSLAGSHAAGDELLGFDSEAFFLAPDLGPVRSVSRAASLPGLAPRTAAGAALLAQRVQLRLAWLDPANAAGSSASAARDEAERVFKALGLAVAWRRTSTEEPPREDEFRVILLDRAALNARRANVLGSTPERFDGPPFVWIHVPGVRRVLGIVAEPSGSPELRHIRGLGIALGRVIAHEILHALVPAVPHGEGLMKSSLTFQDLSASSAPVTPELIAIVRGALEGRAAPARPDGGLLAAEHAQGEPGR